MSDLLMSPNQFYKVIAWFIFLLNIEQAITRQIFQGNSASVVDDIFLVGCISWTTPCSYATVVSDQLDVYQSLQTLIAERTS